MKIVIRNRFDEISTMKHKTHYECFEIFETNENDKSVFLLTIQLQTNYSTYNLFFKMIS